MSIRCIAPVSAALALALAVLPGQAWAQTSAGQKPARPAGTAAATKQPATAMTNQLPPIIDREQFFGDPEIAGAQISPDGRFIAFLKPFNGTRNIWVKTAEEPFDAARPLTSDTRRPISSFFWSRDAKYVLFVQDQGGDENFNVYAVSPSEKPAAGAQVPAARNLTDAKGVRAEIFAVPKSDPDAIFVGLNDRDKAWHDLYKVKISTGDRTLVSKNTERLTSYVFDTKDQLRLVTRSAENGDTEVLRADPGDAFSKIYSCNVFESCGPVHFHKDGHRVYMETNRGTDVDLTRLTLLDVQTGKEELVEADPLKKVDLGGASFSDKTDDLIVTIYVDAKRRLYWKDKAFEADYTLLKGKFPGREIGFASSTADERRFIVSVTSDVEPGETYLFDRDTKKLTLQYRIREKLPRAALAPMKPVTYASSDGLQIPAYLTLPAGVAPKNLPAIIFPHGGPWARDNWGYSAVRAVPRQPRLRGPHAELPRLDRLRQEVPRRGEPAVGREDAGRRDVGREVPRVAGHRGPEADRDHGRLVRRLRHAGRRRLHARRLRGRRLHRRAVQPDHADGVHPALLGGGAQGVRRAHGRRRDARGQAAARDASRR